MIILQVSCSRDNRRVVSMLFISWNIFLSNLAQEAINSFDLPWFIESVISKFLG